MGGWDGWGGGLIGRALLTNVLVMGRVPWGPREGGVQRMPPEANYSVK